jgi:hypothetical protein
MRLDSTNSVALCWNQKNTKDTARNIESIISLANDADAPISVRLHICDFTALTYN